MSVSWAQSSCWRIEAAGVLEDGKTAHDVTQFLSLFSSSCFVFLSFAFQSLNHLNGIFEKLTTFDQISCNSNLNMLQ